MSEDNLEERFEEIIQDAIIEAEGVTCSLEEFLDGLKQMAETLNSRIEMG